jgi:hypothetical protein
MDYAALVVPPEDRLDINPGGEGGSAGYYVAVLNHPGRSGASLAGRCLLRFT